MRTRLLETSALIPLAAVAPCAGSRLLRGGRRAAAAGALILAALLAPVTIESSDSGAVPIAGDAGDDELGEDELYDDDGTLTDNPDRADRGGTGERGEYREGEFGERDDAGWNPPPSTDDAGGDLLDGLRNGGGAPPPGSGAPLIDSVGQGGSSGLLD